jgi:hypothetical protein
LDPVSKNQCRGFPPGALAEVAKQESAYLFSELNWWLLKILLAPLPPEGLLRVPSREYRNASELAAAA